MSVSSPAPSASSDEGCRDTKPVWKLGRAGGPGHRTPARHRPLPQQPQPGGIPPPGQPATPGTGKTPL